jgi:hypothetical protein
LEIDEVIHIATVEDTYEDMDSAGITLHEVFYNTLTLKESHSSILSKTSTG